MIRSYNDHAANERTFLAWVRTAFSAVALGIVVKKGSLLAVVVAGASQPGLSGSAQDYISNYGGSALVGIGMAVLAGAAVRFVRTALRIDDRHVHSAGIVRLTSALSRRSRQDSGTAERVSANANPASASRRNKLLRSVRRINPKLGGSDIRQIH